MSLSSEQLTKVRDGLQTLVFDVSLDRTDKTVDEASYVDHYNLSMSSELMPVRHCLGAYFSSGFQLATQYWIPDNPRGTYFVVHGYFDHVGLYGHLIRHLLTLGYAVVAFDLPGHGLSSGDRVTIGSFDHYVDIFSDLLHGCETYFPKPWKAVGQSTGGAILIKYIMAAKPHHYQSDLEHVVVLAPLIHPRSWKKSLYLYKLLHRFLNKIKRKLYPNTANEEFNQFLANDDPLQTLYIPLEWVGSMKRWTEEFAALPPNDYPLKVVQGDCDRTVAWKYNLKELERKFCNVDIEIVHGAQHHMVNEGLWLRDKVFKKIN